MGVHYVCKTSHPTGSPPDGGSTGMHPISIGCGEDGALICKEKRI